MQSWLRRKLARRLARRKHRKNCYQGRLDEARDAEDLSTAIKLFFFAILACIASMAAPARCAVLSPLVWLGEILCTRAPTCVLVLISITGLVAWSAVSSNSLLNRPHKPGVLVTVLGAGPHPVNIKLCETDTVADLLNTLRRQRRIASLDKIHQSLLFPLASRQALDETANLMRAGVRNLSVLYLRHSVLGGAPLDDVQEDDLHAPEFTRDRAKRRRRANDAFEGRRSDVWQYDAPSELYTCLVCPGSRKYHRHNINSHEQSSTHERRLKAHDSAVATAAMPAGSSSTLSSIVSSTDSLSNPRVPGISPEYVGGGRLGRILSQLDQGENLVPADSTTHEYEQSKDLALDWEALGPRDAGNIFSFDEDSGADHLYNLVYDRIRDDESLPGSSSESEGDVDGYADGNMAQAPTLEQMAEEAQASAVQESSPWFPWPDRLTYIFDVLRNIPRCAFSRKQIGAIRWAMSAAGLGDRPPSDSTLDTVDRNLQEMCGIRSIRYSGKLGHVYYANDLAGIIAQEMANPNVRPQLHFLPEDTAPKVSEAWQAERWLHELDPQLATPMIRLGKQDYYVFEPALLRGNGGHGVGFEDHVFMPIRWFLRNGRKFGKAWRLHPVKAGDGREGWLVDARHEVEVDSAQLLLSFPEFVEAFHAYNVADPRNIFGIQRTDDATNLWDQAGSDPINGNAWRKKARGHRSVSFPIWLYCDDTSGNVSKRWNKHNSFLFTAAGLPRCEVHKESSIHFLSTSNIAPPLEMLDGIVDQLEAAQTEGVWAWDCIEKEFVLVIIAVLAMLGDNPMQSEFACHIGFMGRLFCRVCWATRGLFFWDEGDGDEDADTKSAARTKGKKETLQDMIFRLNNFMSKALPRRRHESVDILRSQFRTSLNLGAKAEYERQRTVYGIKDVFMEHFVYRLFDVNKRGGGSKAFKEKELERLKRDLPVFPYSPVWRIRDFDPHSDTPVEILHVILLGFVKYFWRDTLTRLNKRQLETLKIRISSFDVRGLGVSPLSGERLVTYGRSLTGSDFRVIAQIAPFVLQGLMKQENIDVWCALSVIVTMAWQSEILDMGVYIPELELGINNFLDRVCVLTPQWFNKPKFHVLLHLPDHIRRFGPAMLFATEGFESFNAVIRAASVHSNRHAPSRDIAAQMARRNRVRHLLSGGMFLLQATKPTTRVGRSLTQTLDLRSNELTINISPWTTLRPDTLNPEKWRVASTEPRRLLENGLFGMRVLDLPDPPSTAPNLAGMCTSSGETFAWQNTIPGANRIPRPAILDPYVSFERCDEVLLTDGSHVRPMDWVLYSYPGEAGTPRRVGRIRQILQGTSCSGQRGPGILCIQQAIIGEVHEKYGMRRLELLDLQFSTIVFSNSTCAHVNVQHNCSDNECAIVKTRLQRQEGEVATEKTLEVQHRGKGDDVLLNTAQMRSSAYLHPLQPRLPTLDRAIVIESAAKVEFSKKTVQ